MAVKKAVVIRALIVVLGCAHCTFVAATFVSSSTITNCVNAQTDIVSSCKEKIVIGLTVDLASSDYLEANISSIMDQTNAVRQFASPLQIRISMQDAKLIYALQYRQRVNNKPYEEVINKSLFFDTCDDGSTSDTPTCGWTLDSSGSRIKYSQGYCCTCGLQDILGISSDTTRGDMGCGLLQDNSASAHCMRFDSLWYDTFDILPPTTYYAININVSQNGAQNFSLQLSPTSNIATDGQDLIQAVLIGNFESFTEPTPFSANYRLLIPTVPASDPRVTGDPNSNWMLLENENFDLTGATCNRVGVSFEAFQNEYNACSKEVNSCLNNQPQDYYNEDMAAKQAGVKGNYLLENFGYFEVGSYNDTRYLELDMSSESKTAMITITLSADNILFITPRSQGKIVAASARNFDAGTQQGEANATVCNTGNVTAQYTLTVNCSANILPVVAKTLKLDPAQVLQVSFQIYSNNAIGGATSCSILLYDSMMDRVDQRTVNFTVSAIQPNTGSQGGNTVDNFLLIYDQSCSSCDHWYDVFCFVLYECWWQLAILAVVFIGIPSLVICIILCCAILLVTAPYLAPLCQLIPICCESFCKCVPVCFKCCCGMWGCLCKWKRPKKSKGLDIIV